MKAQAKFTVRQIVVTLGSASPVPPQLLVEILIDCEECGQTEGLFFGHHIKTLHAALGKIIEARGELCGEVGTVKETLDFHGVVDPSKVRNN